MTFEQNILPCSYFSEKTPLLLENGTSIDELTVAYESYGKLNKNKSNAIIVCHALSGDQFLASKNPITNKDGWWDRMVGPGKPIDTDRYFVICANVLGGCIGSTGPTSIDPKTNEAYGLNFPVITISDMVNAQIRLINHLGIEKLLSVIGGSMGGMQVLEWAASYPDRLLSAIPIATSSRHTAQNIAFHELGRQAIMADPDWNNGNYIKLGTNPTKGLSIARMTAHVTYLSEASLTKKFGRRLQDKQEISFGFDADFQIESYLRHQGLTFVDRFDANSYLYITRAMDYFDLEKTHRKTLTEIFEKTKTRF
ncbi:MAG: homoserine O-acetyltransferase, partial [Alphaproteobacteria bacterium]|nr:homoserine O-acetyltransferase [Alphaproteobacteria bacterium]